MAIDSAPRPRYRSFIGDSARWEGLALRDDDVIVTTPAKSGTTWMQTIGVSLVRGPPPWDPPLDEISPWLDVNPEPVADVHARFDAQRHRRVIKSHTPLDGLPSRPGAQGDLEAQRVLRHGPPPPWDQP